MISMRRAHTYLSQTEHLSTRLIAVKDSGPTIDLCMYTPLCYFSIPPSINYCLTFYNFLTEGLKSSSYFVN